MPEERRLALVGNADRRKIAWPQAGGRQAFRDHQSRVAPDFARIVLDAARTRIDLFMLALRPRDDFPGTIENDESRARRALVYRADVTSHVPSRLFRQFVGYTDFVQCDVNRH